MPRYLIVGGDGLIGSALRESLGGGGDVVATTRRADDSGRIRLDLESGQLDAAFAARCDFAFVCAGITSIQACEARPDESRRVNVTETVRLMEGLAAGGCHTIFISSNAVFDGQSPFPDEDALHSPTTEYGRQKAAVEREVRNSARLARGVSIVRLSKVVSAGSGMAQEFLGRLRAGEPCRAFEDLMLCPASLAYVCAGLLAIASARSPGVFHLSGAEEMSYAGFAGLLAGRLGAPSGLVIPESSREAGTKLLYSPRHPGLGMIRTRERTGLAPESLHDLLDVLVPDAGPGR
jgi:dTDP-4-dehydrorhamnose reductase